MLHPQNWLITRPEGLYCVPADLFIDPTRAVPRAVVTHAHADHARAGHQALLASAETVALMRARYGANCAGSVQVLAPGTDLRLGDVSLQLQPAGHVLGSCQVVLNHGGARVVISGDYKRGPDASCAPFLPVPCDVFITEATFALPVFVHPPAAQELQKLLTSLTVFPDRAHVLSVYSLGKCQRVLAGLRALGYDAPVYAHAALLPLCAIYEEFGVALGALRPLAGAKPADLAGRLIMAPPGAMGAGVLRKLPDPVIGFASGWMRLRQRARASGVELPLVISDHADWPELLRTLQDVDAPEIWVTHGTEDALIHAAQTQSRRARALRLIGYGDEEAAANVSLPDAGEPGAAAAGAQAH